MGTEKNHFLIHSPSKYRPLIFVGHNFAGIVVKVVNLCLQPEALDWMRI